MIKNRISLFLATFLIIGFFFLALPEKGYSGLAPIGQPVCCIGQEGCVEFEQGDLVACFGESRIDGGVCTELGEGGDCVLPSNTTPIPTLSEWGLLAMAGILGIVGYLVIRRRKVTA